jgi:hypothetical protein
VACYCCRPSPPNDGDEPSEGWIEWLVGIFIQTLKFIKDYVLPLVVGCVKVSAVVCAIIIPLFTPMTTWRASIKNLMALYTAILGILKIFHQTLEILIQSLESFERYVKTEEFRNMIKDLKKYCAHIAAVLRWLFGN